MTNRLGYAAVAAMIALSAARAGAQITTVIANPTRHNGPGKQAVAQREQAEQDSVARVTLTGMKDWVDSAAAALAIRPDTGALPTDTAGQSAQVRAPADRSARQATEPASEFRDGARAPDTATPIPTLALAGAALIVLGVALQRWPRAARPRARRT